MSRGKSDYSSSTVHSQETERRIWFSIQAQPGYWIRMNSGSGGSQRPVASVASDDRSVCHRHESSPSSGFLPSPRSEECRHRCSSASTVGQHAGVCFSSVLSDSPCIEQGQIIQQSFPLVHHFSLASEVVVSRLSELVSRSPSHSSRMEGSTHSPISIGFI